MKVENPGPLKIILDSVRSYLKYLAAVPAIVAQAIGCIIGLVSILTLVQALDQPVLDQLQIKILTFFNLENFSFHGNPIKPILYLYLIFGLMADLISAMLKGFFGLKWQWNRKKTFFALTILATINYLLLVISILVSSDFFIWPIIIFWSLTVLATGIALAAGKIIDSFSISFQKPR